MIIDDILAREVLDSRGNPTVEVEVFWLTALQVVPLFPLVLPQVHLKQ